jgi:hypothetical protein
MKYVGTSSYEHMDYNIFYDAKSQLLTPLASTNTCGYCAFTSAAAAWMVTEVKLSSITMSAPAAAASHASATLWHSTYSDVDKHGCTEMELNRNMSSSITGHILFHGSMKSIASSI